MSDDLPMFPAVNEPIDPIGMARRDLQKSLPRRFYKDATVAALADGGFALHLDGKPVRTPAKAPFALPTRALAEAVALEWQAQGALIEPGTMPLTRLANSAIDGVARMREATIAEIAKFAETDLVCYRAGDPDALVEAQAEAWVRVLAFARDMLGARFICAQGIIYVEQPVSALAAVRSAVEAIADGPAGTLRLAALSVMTSLTGSVLIALAITRDAMSVESAWQAANVDDAYQARVWGPDEEAAERNRRRWDDMRAAATLYTLVV